MPRMFDVLKGTVDSSKYKGRHYTQKTPDLAVGFRRQIRKIFSPDKCPTDAMQVSRKLIDAVKKKDMDSPEIAKEKYDLTLMFTKVLLNKLEIEKSFILHTPDLYKNVDSLANQLILGDSLLGNVAEEYTADNYIPRHLVNVCILALMIGMQTKFNKSKLHILGMAALLHDIGLLCFKDIIQQPRQLSYEEFREKCMVC